MHAVLSILFFTLPQVAGASRCVWGVSLQGSITNTGRELSLNPSDCKAECEKDTSCKSISIRGGKCVLHDCTIGSNGCTDWKAGVGAHYVCGLFDECYIYKGLCPPGQECKDSDLSKAGGWMCSAAPRVSPPLCSSVTEEKCSGACKWLNATSECVQVEDDDDDDSLMRTVGFVIVCVGFCLFVVGCAGFFYERRKNRPVPTPEEDPLVDTHIMAMQSLNTRPPSASTPSTAPAPAPVKIKTLDVDNHDPSGPLFVKGVEQPPASALATNSGPRRFRRHHFPVEPLRRPEQQPHPNNSVHPV